MTPSLTETAPGRFRIDGELTFATVTPVWRRSRRLFARASGPIVIDLAGVQYADSAALSLLVEWLRLARRGNLQLTFTNLPKRLVPMVHAYDLDSILPLHG